MCAAWPWQEGSCIRFAGYMDSSYWRQDGLQSAPCRSSASGESSYLCEEVSKDCIPWPAMITCLSLCSLSKLQGQALSHDALIRMRYTSLGHESMQSSTFQSRVAQEVQGLHALHDVAAIIIEEHRKVL